MTILEWAKANAKDGANFAELEEMIEKSNPLNAIKTVPEADVFIRENAVLMSALDSNILKAVTSHDAKFMETKFPELIKTEREKIRQEINPKESDSDKKIRELREELDTEKGQRKNDALKLELRTKASEIAVPAELADSFVVYGDKAIDRLVEVGEHLNTAIKTGIETGIKERFKGRTAPNAGNIDPNAKVMSRTDYEASAPQAQSDFIAAGGQLTD